MGSECKRCGGEGASYTDAQNYGPYHKRCATLGPKKSAAEWLERQSLGAELYREAYSDREKKLLSMLRDAKAELERMEGLASVAIMQCAAYEGSGVAARITERMQNCKGWVAIEAKWKAGKYR